MKSRRRSIWPLVVAGAGALAGLLYVSPLGPSLVPLTLYSDSTGPAGLQVRVYLLPSPSMEMPRRNAALSDRDVFAELRDAHGWLRHFNNPWDPNQASSAELVGFTWSSDEVSWAAARSFPLPR